MISIVMGSESDLATLEAAIKILKDFEVSYEYDVVSAHRSPEKMFSFAKSAKEKGIKCIIAAAGGAAHLPGMVSALTPIPVLGVPVKSSALNGIDSLLSIVQMPAGVPTATFSIGQAGAKNAALFAIQIMALHDSEIAKRLTLYRQSQVEKVQQMSFKIKEKAK